MQRSFSEAGELHPSLASGQVRLLSISLASSCPAEGLRLPCGRKNSLSSPNVVTDLLHSPGTYLPACSCLSFRKLKIHLSQEEEKLWLLRPFAFNRKSSLRLYHALLAARSGPLGCVSLSQGRPGKGAFAFPERLFVVGDFLKEGGRWGGRGGRGEWGGVEEAHCPPLRSTGLPVAFGGL